MKDFFSGRAHRVMLFVMVFARLMSIDEFTCHTVRQFDISHAEVPVGQRAVLVCCEHLEQHLHSINPGTYPV